MGFGHRVYKTGDPRARILKDYCTRLAAEIGDDRWERIAEPIEQAVTSQKNLPPNVDWPSARLYHYMNLDIELYTPIFAMGARRRLGGTRDRATRPQSADAASGTLRRPPQPRG